MSEPGFKARRLVLAAIPTLPTSYLLLRSDQQLFGLSSNFLAGFVAFIGLASVFIGAVRLLRDHNLY